MDFTTTYCHYALYRGYKYTTTREKGYTVLYLCCNRCFGCDFITDVEITSRTTKRKYKREFIRSVTRQLPTVLAPRPGLNIVQQCLELMPK